VTPEAMAVLVALCRQELPTGITAARLAAIATAESNGNVRAISAPNRNSTRDYGLFQINESNFARFGVNAQSVMSPCKNLEIGVAILAEADVRALCLYNSGRPHCPPDGYPARVHAAAARAAGKPAVVAPAVIPHSAARPKPPKPPDACAAVPAFDSWAKARCRERQRSITSNSQRRENLHPQPQAPEPKAEQ
jgi:hypothetical protein